MSSTFSNFTLPQKSIVVTPKHSQTNKQTNKQTKENRKMNQMK